MIERGCKADSFSLIGLGGPAYRLILNYVVPGF